MRKLRGFHHHQVAPKEFRQTQDITGSHELDESIHRSKNKDAMKKLRDYITHDEAYGPLTAYSGYRGYRGDS